VDRRLATAGRKPSLVAGCSSRDGGRAFSRCGQRTFTGLDGGERGRPTGDAGLRRINRAICRMPSAYAIQAHFLGRGGGFVPRRWDLDADDTGTAASDPDAVRLDDLAAAANSRDPRVRGARGMQPRGGLSSAYVTPTGIVNALCHRRFLWQSPGKKRQGQVRFNARRRKRSPSYSFSSSVVAFAAGAGASSVVRL
jgi:hypothetical protein